ncbi:hypothetical protein GCM10027275_16690 [Rhabdobacter roseus]|uniref:Protocatechuate 3,4-dioxygenase beta subunit n=1 Tax=Rhabdobacter roseus TaxID=1655419 RepID=A0A840TJK0_9BACT|nr:hypothetical protein [Rhabdobacter roseus]MBB5283591.1 protocatechuate 3,4-dioxygenase beta subunit [Rhabdobacter roseus]
MSKNHEIPAPWTQPGYQGRLGTTPKLTASPQAHIDPESLAETTFQLLIEGSIDESQAQKMIRSYEDRP